MDFKKIRTDVTNQTADGVLDLATVPGAMDVSFENLGLTVCTIRTKAGNIVVNPGDPMLTFGGYPGYFRADFFNFEFVTGLGHLNVYINIHTNFNNC